MKKALLRILLFSISFLSITISSCTKASHEKGSNDLPSVVERLNSFTSGLASLAEAVSLEDTIIIFNVKNLEQGSSLYQIQTLKGLSFSFENEIIVKKVSVPKVSVGLDGNEYYWRIDSNWLLDDEGKVNVLDKNKTPYFFIQEGAIHYRLGKSGAVMDIENIQRTNSPLVDLSIDINKKIASFSLVSKTVIKLPLYDNTSLLKKNVLNECYYKDVFLDAGVGLTSRLSLPAATRLKLSLEAISFSRSAELPEEISLQNRIIAGNSDDVNGRLLYPDGQPRYKLLFVNGGNSASHGSSLGEDGRARMKAFINKGGSYVGTCAGAFFASSGSVGYSYSQYYLGAFPSELEHTGISNGSTDMTIETNSPLLRYYSFGGKLFINDVRHNGGGYPISLPSGTEVLARYSCPDKLNVHGQPSVWAYKANPSTGRLVLTGSHPEEVNNGDRLDLTAAMMLYAMAGRDEVSIKGFLKNGETRSMDKTTSDNQPDFTRIGDKQCHHFAVFIPRNAKDISFSVDSNTDVDLVLMLCSDTYAFPDKCNHKTTHSGNHQKLSFSSLEEGIWYVSVQCATSVTVKEESFGQDYTGNLYVLNGIPYSVRVSWSF